MNLQEVEIENYKGISNLKFNPKKLNLVIGKNNTSKTSVIEAIDLLFNNEEIENRHMNSYFNIYSKEKVIKISSKVDGKKEKIELREARESDIISAFRKDLINNFLENLRKKSNQKFGDLLIKELEKVIEKGIDQNLRTFLIKNSLILNKDNKEEVYYGIYDFTLVEKIEELIDSLSEYILERLPEDSKKEYNKYLRYASEKTLFSTRGILSERMKTKKEKSVLYIDEDSLITDLRKSFAQRKPEDSEKLHKVKKIIKEKKLIENFEDLDFDNVLFSTSAGTTKAHSFMFLGDGIQSIIGFLWKFLDKIDNKIVLFDEPETHMHPGYLKQLINFIIDFSQEMNIQFFIVTHSPDFLDIIFSEDLEKERIDYIKSELNILKMDKINEETGAECFNYKEAKETREKLYMDLRGV